MENYGYPAAAIIRFYLREIGKNPDSYAQLRDLEDNIAAGTELTLSIDDITITARNTKKFIVQLEREEEILEIIFIDQHPRTKEFVHLLCLVETGRYKFKDPEQEEQIRKLIFERHFILGEKDGFRIIVPKVSEKS